MHYLIDGHNLIGKLPGLSLDDPDDEVKLAHLLKRWCAADPRRKVTVIFDAGLPGGEAKHLSGGGVKVVFAPNNRTADAVIIQRIAGIKHPPEYTIVSSDRVILEAAQRRRFPVQRSEDFATAMLADRTFRDKKDETKIDDRPEVPAMNPDELAEWLTLFGPEPERPATATPSRRPTPSELKREEIRRKKAEQEKKRADEIDEWLRLFGYKD